MTHFKKRRIDILKPVKMPKAPPPGNRIFKNHKIKWAGGIITVRAMIDQYPAGNIMTYIMSVRRGKELIERNQFSESNSKTMLARITELREIPEANYK